MDKLTTLKPEGERSRYRAAIEPWRAWYRIERWRLLRMRVFVRDNFTCQWHGCGRLEGNTSQLVAHHKKPHHGNDLLFWDEANVTTVCKPCHDGPIKAMEMGSSFDKVIGRDGWPTDPKHPSNR